MSSPEEASVDGVPNGQLQRIERLNGVGLFVRELGIDKPGVPLVVIHGGPDWDHSYLLPGLLPVAKRRRVVMFDMRGCGRSSLGLGEGGYQPEHVVEDARQLVASLAAAPVDLLGFSTGGQLAQLLVDSHPDIVRRLVLASTTAYPDMSIDTATWPEAAARASSRPAWPSWVPSPRSSSAEGRDLTIQWAIDGAPRFIWDLNRLDEYLDLLSRVRFTGEWIGPFLSGQLHPLRPDDPEAALRRFGGPVLVLHGAQDMCFAIQAAQRLAGAVENAQLRVIDEAGHMAQFERPDRWASAITEFLE